MAKAISNMGCKSCIHQYVCRYKDEAHKVFEEFFNSTLEFNYPFIIELKCVNCQYPPRRDRERL